MARILSVVFIALAACSIVATEDLLSCSGSRYFPSQYTCYDDTQLCPILNGTITLPCGLACYDPNQYSCSDLTLEFYNPNVSNALNECGFSQYDPSKAVCFDGFFLCPRMGTVTLKCGATCYTPSNHYCALAQDCVADGCEPLPCCPGLIAVASKCRSLCDFNPNGPNCIPLPR
ncbi:hypothetical protein DFH08DRAFT_841328 [Mycena albidolilacea]|uniref:Endo-1,3(4)-beta-glucanase 1 carbohydrate binding domain-containing protein n=1 Tax=Mycena albidolilacea TaxID=1033008 RepID=A0AAD7ALX0_9AGAR|nr:hypothetical protein DFH08DRAFT_841328 [Mycena albidolilacea]